MHPGDPVEQILKALWLRFSEAGHGSIARTQRALGLGESYFKDWRRSGTVDPEVLIRTLDHLGVPPGEFFADVFGSPDPIAILRRETAALGEPPPIVARLRARLEEAGKDLAEPLSESHSALIAQLDAMRYEDPFKGLELTESSMEMVITGVESRSLGIPLLAVWGSAKRISSQLDDAQQALMAAFDIAERQGNEAALGDLYQRLGYVVGDRGFHQRALVLTQRSLRACAMAADTVGIGKALVDCGVWLSRLEKIPQAIKAQTAALKLLPPKQTRYRFAALQNLGIVYLKLRQPERADHFVQQATTAVADLGRNAHGKLLWLQGRVEASRKRYHHAERFFSEAAKACGSICPLECSMASTELVRVQLLQGKSSKAYKIAKEMARLFEPLQDNKVALAALMELLRCAVAGRGLTVALTDRVIAALEEEQVRPRGRTRKKRRRR